MFILDIIKVYRPFTLESCVDFVMRRRAIRILILIRFACPQPPENLEFAGQVCDVAMQQLPLMSADLPSLFTCVKLQIVTF